MATSAFHRDALRSHSILMERQRLCCDGPVRPRFHRLTKSKKKPPPTVGPILFCRQNHYADGNSEIVDAVRTRRVVRPHESFSSHSAAAAAGTRGNYCDLRAGCRKGRAECCDSVYHTDGLAGTDGVSAFR